MVVVSLMYGENVCFIRFGSTFCIESWINKIIVYIYETLHLWLVEGLGNSKYNILGGVCSCSLWNLRLSIITKCINTFTFLCVAVCFKPRKFWNPKWFLHFKSLNFASLLKKLPLEDCTILEKGWIFGLFDGVLD